MRGQDKSKLMNNKFAKAGNFFLKIEIINLEATRELVGDTAAGLSAIASVVGHILKQTSNPKIALKMFNNIIEKILESD